MRIIRRIALAGLASGLIAPARAHGFHASFTIVELNPRTQSLEILHRIFIQDLELILTARTGEQTKLEEGPRTEKLIEDYLLRVFSLKAADGQTLKPEWIGMKLEVDTAFIYQEVPKAGPLTGLTVADQILTETNNDQVNSVNVTIGGRTQTAVFTINDPAQTLNF